MGREWEFSYRLGIRPWLLVALLAPVEPLQLFLSCIRLVKEAFQMVCHLGLVAPSTSCLFFKLAFENCLVGPAQLEDNASESLK